MMRHGLKWNVSFDLIYLLVLTSNDPAFACAKRLVDGALLPEPSVSWGRRGGAGQGGLQKITKSSYNMILLYQ